MKTIGYFLKQKLQAIENLPFREFVNFFIELSPYEKDVTMKILYFIVEPENPKIYDIPNKYYFLFECTKVYIIYNRPSSLQMYGVKKEVLHLLHKHRKPLRHNGFDRVTDRKIICYRLRSVFSLKPLIYRHFCRVTDVRS